MQPYEPEKLASARQVRKFNGIKVPTIEKDFHRLDQTGGRLKRLRARPELYTAETLEIAVETAQSVAKDSSQVCKEISLPTEDTPVLSIEETNP